MTVLEAVRALIDRLAGDAICDECITSELSLPFREQSNEQTRILAREDEYVREKARCSICERNRKVIRLAMPEITVRELTARAS